MQNADAANTMPGGDNMSVWHQAPAQGAQISTDSVPKEWKEPGLPGRILVVEDDISLATLEADVLTACGYSVVLAGNGELAVAVLRQAIPDLVVLDLELPGTMNGWDVLQVLRTHSKIPVLLTSSETGVRKRMRTSGESRVTLDQLPKPYPMQTLLKRIKRMLVIVPP